PPRTAAIVPVDDERVTWIVRDHDVAEIDTATGEVISYHSGIGTNLVHVAVRPGAREAWVSNTDAQNLIPHEPALPGRFIRNRITRLTPGGGDATAFDLNPGIDYEVLPNPAAREAALAQPSALVFSPEGDRLWVAAFGSDRVAELDPNTGDILRRID